MSLQKYWVAGIARLSTDVERRFADHQADNGAKYLRGRGPLELVFKKRIGKRELALKIERLVKKLPKQEKEQLIKKNGSIKEIRKRSLLRMIL